MFLKNHVIQPYPRYYIKEIKLFFYSFSFLFFFEFSNNFPSNSSHILSKFAAIISVDLVIRNLNHSFLKQLQHNHTKKPNITVRNHESDLIFILFLFYFEIHNIPIILAHNYREKSH